MGAKLYDRLSLKTLKLVLAIEKFGSLTQAAEELHTAVSAASRRIQFLESSLGHQVIIRTGRGISLTPFGRVVANYARRIAADIDQLEDNVRDLAVGNTEKIRFAVPAPALYHDLPEQLDKFLRNYPSVSLLLKELKSQDVVDSLLGGQADVGIILSGHIAPSLEVLPYRRDRLSVVVNPSHPLASRTSVKLDELLEENWVLPHETAMGQTLLQEAAKRGVDLLRRAESRSPASSLRIVHSGLGVTILPHDSSAAEISMRGLVAISIVDDWAQFDLWLATLRSNTLSPSISALVKALSEADEPVDPVEP
ncbi:LysR family transcriptional regulator [Methylocella sp. CPCC 101449]|jgi:DNA-binding transcriptional LysR family regulator|uniref:LysR family transcriptional regulator n=1 Tax=Methylocella sp. CPCC 101449 TaxID=2987531 RepID=UPI00288FC3AE|nr:LysR family transcriptional regulator [Methylocella sp. CPCC 101449]MDT2023192.1 LysR family transcriptional regulator [Methylocella sp. CPCC 101449]HEV2570146.1 LysR family transcriptional regulator [Beijerinckiaceae bacterium]